MTKLILLLPLGALAALGCVTAIAQPEPVTVEKTLTISATVESIDADKRLLELRTARLPEGANSPGAAVANKVTTTVVIEAVDRSAHSVTFLGPSGMLRTIDVVDPKAQQFIGSLQKGDEVQLTYIEALAVTLEPTKPL